MTAGPRRRPFRLSLLLSVLAASLMLAAAGLFPWLYKQLDHEPWAVSTSPDGRFRLEYYAIPFLPLRPDRYIGLGCTDCPGYLRLVDREGGKILAEKYFRMQHELSSGVEWRPREVRVRRFVTWILP
jgi:hypothetical protein